MDPATPHQHVAPMPAPPPHDPNVPPPQHFVALPHPPPTTDGPPAEGYTAAPTNANQSHPIPMYMISAVRYPPMLPWPDISGKCDFLIRFRQPTQVR